MAKLHYSLYETSFMTNKAIEAFLQLFNIVEQWGCAPEGGKPYPFNRKYKEPRRERLLTEREKRWLGRLQRQNLFEDLEHSACMGTMSPFTSERKVSTM